MATHQYTRGLTSRDILAKSACDKKDKAMVLSTDGPFMIKANIIHRGIKIYTSGVMVGYCDGSLAAPYPTVNDGFHVVTTRKLAGICSWCQSPTLAFCDKCRQFCCGNLDCFTESHQSMNKQFIVQSNVFLIDSPLTVFFLYSTCCQLNATRPQLSLYPNSNSQLSVRFMVSGTIKIFFLLIIRY